MAVTLAGMFTLPRDEFAKALALMYLNEVGIETLDSLLQSLNAD